MKAFLLLFLFCCTLKGAGLGVYNPAQHAVNGFMPTQLPDLQLWLDASKLPFTNGTAVDVWQDFSGKSNWATNGTGSKQPTITTLNGRTALSFDGVDDWFAIKDFETFTYITAVVVVKQTSTNAKPFFIEQSATANTNPGFYIVGGYGYVWAFNREGKNHGAMGETNWLGQGIAIASYTYNGSGSYYKNSQLRQNNAVYETSRTNTLVTDVLNICSRNGSAISDCKIGEIVFFTNKISDYSLLQIHRYLGTKYGIVVQ